MECHFNWANLCDRHLFKNAVSPFIVALLWSFVDVLVVVVEEAGVQNNHSNKHSTIFTQLDLMPDEERLTKARSVALADSDLSGVKGSSDPSLIITLGVGLCFKKSKREGGKSNDLQVSTNTGCKD